VADTQPADTHTTIRVSKPIAKMLMLVARHRDTSVHELISKELGPQIARIYRDSLQEMSAVAKKATAPAATA
jgi:hypothetical protein